MVSPPTQPPTAQVPWSPTAHAFAQHQFSQVVNFWKQGRQASYRLEALPGGQAELNLTFKLPSVSEVIPPPSHLPTVPECTVPNPQRPIIPLFPKGCFPKKSGPDPKPKSAPPKVSSRRRKNYWRSVLHKATLATSSLPPPTNGSLRQAAQACVQRMQAASVSAQNTKKRELPTSSPILSPSNSSPLAQRIRLDLQIGEREEESPEKDFEIDGNEVDQVESPEKELLRSHPSPQSVPSESTPSGRKVLPAPAPLVFTPSKTPESPNWLNCDVKMTPDHQCESGGEESDVIAKVVEEDKSVEAEQVIESAEVEQMESAIVEQEVEQVIKSAKAEQKFSEFRKRWIERIEKSTDDLALRARLLECLEDAWWTPVSDLSNEDFDEVKDRFLEGVLSPVGFLNELQEMLSKI